ncbi:DUF4260 family protein [Ammoniphilus resinae]|uniref:DUF4260 family protein n=1 Tax=Ammoniphilus resinae TaxID=861532 RepID=A0ABS4GRL8_9BACL|nr:DUF4260 family protein [Ammoniphilus resinae]MBP1932918.1 hypothetical protein [Ammoniphilus resinae]
MERVLYRLENAFIGIVALYVFLIYGTTWTTFLCFLVLPKVISLLPISSFGNEKGSKAFYVLQSMLHSYSTVAIVAMISFLFLNILFWSIAGWVIHIAIDRVIKYKEKTIPHPLFEVRG